MDKLKTIWSKFLSLKFWQKALVLFLFYVFFASITGLGNSKNSSIEPNVDTKTIQRSYPVEYVRHAVINPATISVAFNIKNDGTKPITPNCKIEMQDPSGTYKGYDFFDITNPIAANQTKQVIVQLTITKEGANFVDKFSGECTATTSDTASNAGKNVKVRDIVNFSATDGSEGWYWGASFKADQQPMTQMNCVVKALDKGGKVIGVTKYRGNTLNDGTVIGYGSDPKSLVDAPQSVVLAIESFDVKCTL